MGAIGWIDFSSEHREKMRAAIDCLSTPGAIDELGIGTIRDAFADILFPGVSTIQTRPKYFVQTARLVEGRNGLAAACALLGEVTTDLYILAPF
ncbi:DUF6361 family protein [Coraliomargarita parva]|uniref:DUF6361 family protein n=1 Tax=Coraliomargarita parva TaxID=3014050 RepID=UPI0022B5977E|nr:DUF6361 family protein [Coraliomargarita parva]